MKSFFSKFTLLLMVFMCISDAHTAFSDQAEQKVKKLPHLEFEATEYDFRSAPEGKVVEHDFVFKNRGEALLAITGVKTGCGCTTAGYDREIPPSGEGRIRVKVNTTGYSGSLINKSLQVYTNDPDNLITVLRVFGRVENIVTISPRAVRLAGKASDDISINVRITPAPKYPFSIKSIHLDDGKNITAEFKPSEDTIGSWDLMVKNIRVKPGRYFDMITLKTDGEIEPVLEINVFGNLTE